MQTASDRATDKQCFWIARLILFERRYDHVGFNEIYEHIEKKMPDGKKHWMDMYPILAESIKSLSKKQANYVIRAYYEDNPRYHISVARNILASLNLLNN